PLARAIACHSGNREPYRSCRGDLGFPWWSSPWHIWGTSPGRTMKPAPFSYHRARSADEAVSLLAELGDEAKLLAGGQRLLGMVDGGPARAGARGERGGRGGAR